MSVVQHQPCVKTRNGNSGKVSVWYGSKPRHFRSLATLFEKYRDQVKEEIQSPKLPTKSEAGFSMESKNAKKTSYQKVAPKHTSVHSSKLASNTTKKQVTDPAKVANALLQQMSNLRENESSYVQTLEILRVGMEEPLQALVEISTSDGKSKQIQNKSTSAQQQSDVLLAPTRRVAMILGVLFKQFPSLIDIHSQLLKDIGEKDLQYFGGKTAPAPYSIERAITLLKKHFHNLKIYVDFSEQHSVALAAFENLCYIDKKFRDAVEKCAANCGVEDIRVLLAKPRERVWYYIGFIQETMSLCELENNESLKTYLHYLKEIYREMGPWLRQIERIESQALLQNQILNLPGPLIRPSQDILLSGPLQYRSDSYGQYFQVHCWLFSDRLICARSGRKGHLIHETTVPLCNPSIVSIGDSESGEDAQVISVCSEKSTVFLMAKDSQEFSIWRNALQYAVRTGTNGTACK